MSEYDYRSLKSMEAEFGSHPHTREFCPLCKSQPGAAHAKDCPWLLWAGSKPPQWERQP